MDNQAICITAGEQSLTHLGMDINGQGISQIEQETITSTREPIFEKEEISETRSVFREISRIRKDNDLISTSIVITK